MKTRMQRELDRARDRLNEQLLERFPAGFDLDEVECELFLCEDGETGVLLVTVRGFVAMARLDGIPCLRSAAAAATAAATAANDATLH